MKNRENKGDVSKYMRRMTWGASVVFAGKFLSKLLGYLYILIAARLGAENYGMLNIGFSLVSLVVIFSFLGLENAVLRYIPYFEAKKDKASIKGTVFLCIKVGLITTIFFTLISLLFSKQIAVLFFHNINLIPIIRIFSFTILPLSFITFFATVFSSFQRVDYDISVREVGEKLLRGILTLVLVYLGFGIIGASVSYIFSTFFMLLVCAYLMQKKVFPIFKTNQTTKYHTKELFLYSLPLLLIVLLNSSTSSISTFFLGYFRTLSEVGVYNVALPTASLVVTIPFAITSLFVPIVTKLFARKKTDLIKQIYKTTSRWIFLINFPLFLIMLFFPRQILTILFGQNYSVGAMALAILSIGYLLYSLNYVNFHILSILKKTNLYFFVTLLFAITNIILSFLLTPHYGVNGAAIAVSVSYILSSIFCSFLTYKQAKLHPFNASFFKPLFAALVAMVAVYSTVKFLLITLNFYGFLIALMGFLAIYSLFLLLFKCFEKEDFEMINVIFQRISPKKRV
ncbi:MAG: flippase [archaeon]